MALAFERVGVAAGSRPVLVPPRGGSHEASLRGRASTLVVGSDTGWQFGSLCSGESECATGYRMCFGVGPSG